jgi:antitoxin HicB
MHFTVRLEPNGRGGFIARVPEVPEALTEGDTRDEAIENASDALEVALLGRMKDGEAIPSPSERSNRKDMAIAHLSAQAAAKLAFYSAFAEAGVSRSALARQLGKDEAEVRRMLDPYHATKLAALDEALQVLGKRLVLTVEPA